MGDASRSAIGPLGLVVLQSTGFCNIDCSYCYLPDRANPRQRMDHATLAQAARLIFDRTLVGGDLDVVWHAGEPLTLQPGYYEQAIAIIEAARPRGVAVHYGIQTNATLIDDAWIDLFERHDINVGVSLDGPRDLHDRHRRYRNGAGSHDRVIAGTSRLRARGYPFHVIGVVTAHALARGAELARYYRTLGPTAIGLNIEELEAHNARSSLYEDIDIARFEGFIADFLGGAASEDAPDIVIRDFQRTVSSLVSGTPEDNDQVVPLRIVSVAFNGDISTFSPELLALDAATRDRFIFGNVHRCGALADILRDDRFRAVYADIRRGVAACADSCEYFQHCGGGAPVNKLSETGRLDATETIFCKLTKQAWVDVCLRLAAAPDSRFDLATRPDPMRGGILPEGATGG
jgi:uncharacterized protein